MTEGKPLKGAWVCTACCNIEATEREIACWQCGKGEMVWFPAREIVAALRSHRPLSEIAWSDELPWE